MCVHRRIRLFQLHNSKIPETPRPKTLKERRRVAVTTTLNRRICNFQLLILRFQNPRPSKTLTDKAQQQQRFSTVSVRVFFFSCVASLHHQAFLLLHLLRCRSILQARGSRKTRRKPASSPWGMPCCSSFLVLCVFFFLVFVFLLWFGLLVLTLWEGFVFKAIASIKLSLFEKNKTVTIVNSQCVCGLPQCCCCCCCLHSCFVFFFRVFFSSQQSFFCRHSDCSE